MNERTREERRAQDRRGAVSIETTLLVVVGHTQN